MAARVAGNKEGDPGGGGNVRGRLLGWRDLGEGLRGIARDCAGQSEVCEECAESARGVSWELARSEGAVSKECGRGQ